MCCKPNFLMEIEYAKSAYLPIDFTDSTVEEVGLLGCTRDRGRDSLAEGVAKRSQIVGMAVDVDAGSSPLH